jgi:hypothetical protein
MPSQRSNPTPLTSRLSLRARPSPSSPQAAAPDRPSSPSAAATTEATLRSAQFTCIYLATKVADQPHAFGLLRFMLSALSGSRALVTTEQAADVELRCLAGLGWRLGPFFAEDPMGEGAEELAAALGGAASRGGAWCV